ncbi:unnamed protein product [Ostreobium quekettii]|uniref:Sodium/sulfate symporter n=1 Tax=Ostreobium quekettii TaxID=121088 RepID=A0A8S1J4V2_9CHLO|nr:unnamed protein product [Ostreobium quekettii]|eukprot:evm.model.scf_195.11 EVM.evm.TU.scf_195.11   scf_195:78380-80098(+)
MEQGGTSLRRPSGLMADMRSASFDYEFIEGARRSFAHGLVSHHVLDDRTYPSSESEDSDANDLAEPFIEHTPGPGRPGRRKASAKWSRGWRSLWGRLARGWRLWLVLAIGVAVKATPPPAAVTPKAWDLMAIFSATIAAILIEALPTGAAAFLGLCATVVTGSLSFEQAFSEFSTEGPWVVATSIFLAGGINKTGLGRRLACLLVSLFGSSTLGLTYSLVFSELLLAPAIPSVAARAGGIMLPICVSLAEACGSVVEDGTERELGAYLIVTLYQTSSVTSSMFLTASSANPLSQSLGSLLADADITWLKWAGGAILPGLVNITLIPVLLWALYPPKLKRTAEARELARIEMRALGPMTKDEWVLVVALLGTVVLWVLGSFFSISLVASAGVGLAMLLLTNVITWDDCISNQVAWDAFTWIAALASMAAALNDMGVLSLFSDAVSGLVDRMHSQMGDVGETWWVTVAILTVLYIYTHYFFAGAVSHVAALYQSFVGMAMDAKCPPLLSALLFAYNSNILGGLTHYSQSHSPMFYSRGYVPLKTFLGLGLVVSVLNIAVWLGVGALWWKVLGLY